MGLVTVIVYPEPFFLWDHPESCWRRDLHDLEYSNPRPSEICKSVSSGRESYSISINCNWRAGVTYKMSSDRVSTMCSSVEKALKLTPDFAAQECHLPNCYLSEYHVIWKVTPKFMEILQ